MRICSMSLQVQILCMNRLSRALIAAFLVFATPVLLYAQAPSNDNCSGAITLTSGNTCNSATYNLRNATSASPAGNCGGATTTTTFDVWFTFQAAATTTTITLSNLGSRFSTNTAYVEVLSGASCSGFTSLGCQVLSATATTRLTISSLTVGTFYYIRVYVLVSPTANPASKWNFDICVQHQPANDDCANPVTLTPGATCANTTGTLDLATANGAGLNTGCSFTSTLKDVWYKFVATSTASYTVTLSNLGANFTSTSNIKIQIYSGTSCG